MGLRLKGILVDYVIIGNTIHLGLAAVINVTPGTTGVMIDDTDVAVLCRELEELGADVVGLNCSYGPDTMIPLMQRVKEKCTVRTCFF